MVLLGSSVPFQARVSSCLPGIGLFDDFPAARCRITPNGGWYARWVRADRGFHQRYIGPAQKS